LHRQKATGWKLSGAGGGGYLVFISEEYIPEAIKIKIRRKAGMD
jgi:mevalonate kinase